VGPERRRLPELTFREFVERMRRTNPPGSDASTLLAQAAHSQTLVELAGGADPRGDLPVERWAAEAGPSVRALARRLLTEWAVTGTPWENADPDQIRDWRQVCREALDKYDL
jgi:hypothetical protein